MVVPLTGQQYEIAAGEYRATVTALGAGLRELLFRGQPLIAGYEPDELPPAGAGALLAPWPNRIEAGRYTFGGTEFQLALTEPARGNAIHGLTRWTAWAPVTHAGGAVVLRSAPHGYQGYPFCVEIDAEYRLEADTGLHVAITARNQGNQAAPYGTGSHPYLTTGAPVIDGCELLLPAARWLRPGDRGIPRGEPEDVTGTPYDFREPRLVADTVIDHAFTALTTGQDGRAWAQVSSAGVRVAFWVGQGYRWLQVFTGDALDPAHRRRAIAIEPMTCPPNSFATGIDLLILQPGDSITHEWGIAVRHS